ncbi:MAG TPA: xanthine dehydrogenase family protein molybdopterin-binding subunit [Xanthobacteraceae bacterium]|nr:xanthine dehydrogenase family protein molybdopterin-binding subunit [Xanthobacteraceae bacterium]
MTSATSPADGRPSGRIEDEQLLRGRGRFIDDAPLAGQVYGCFVRSTHPHARIRGIDITPARTAEGVLAVLTAADMQRAGVGRITRHPPVAGRNGRALIDPPRPALADERVMHVGEPVALVVATSAALAQDAAERVSVSYEELTPVIDAREAVAPGAPQLWPEAPGNLAIDWQTPASTDGANEKEVAQIINAAPHVARISQLNQRIAAATMEPRGATASHDVTTDSYTIRVCSQSAIVLRNALANAMGLEPNRLRVVTEDVGGAFGMKTSVYPEYPALLVAAKQLGRPVHWMANRAESFLTDNQARDMFADAELALDEKGKFQALRLSCVVNLGAYVGSVGVHLATYNFARCLPGMYRIPMIDVRVRCAFTNTVPTAPYRGAGRPEANYLLERVVEETARISGIAQDKLRKRNLIPPSAMPYKTPVGTTYDSGDFPAVFDKAFALAAYGDFPKRRREAGKRGRLRGIGISCFLEHAGGVPTEGAGLAFPGDGIAELQLGSQSTGQAHATVFPRVAAKQLGLPADRVILRQGDSGLEVTSMSTVASRSAVMVGTAVVRAAETVIRKGKKLAAEALEAAEADIVYDRGVFAVTGTDRRIGLFDLAKHARDRKRRGEIAEDLDTKLTADTPQTFPNGCHIAEVEIDPETGTTALVGYTAVDDCGDVLDHMIVEGQVHGGIVQGLGQVLLEHLAYDRAGQLVTGSFMDYAMPRAADIPPLTAAEQSVPATTNPLGVKGVGEAGTTGALAAIMNAIADAVPAAAHIDMPATAEKIWASSRRK